MKKSQPESRSAYLLRRAVERSQRSTGVQLPIRFFRDTAQHDPPLARMLRGGRGGTVRLKLYLSVCLIATSAPYRIDTPIPARAWAEMLDLPDPESKGARRIADALSWLEQNEFVELVRRGGAPPTIGLRSATGRGRPFVRPVKRYVSVPLGLWRLGWINALSGRALAVLLALIDLQGGRDPRRPPSMNAQERERYGFSQDTWTRGERELKERGLLAVARSPQGADFDWRRMRNTYWVDIDRLTRDPAPIAVSNGLLRRQ
jgi:hypothetical protein